MISFHGRLQIPVATKSLHEPGVDAALSKNSLLYVNSQYGEKILLQFRLPTVAFRRLVIIGSAVTCIMFDASEVCF